MRLEFMSIKDTGALYSLEQKQNKIAHEVHITFHYIFLYDKFFYLDIFQEISKVASIFV